MNITEELATKFAGAVLHEPEHVYEINGIRGWKSVSETLQRFYVPFDKSIAKWSAKKEGVSEKKMLEAWKDKATTAALKGTRIHEFAELFGKGEIGADAATHIQENAVVQWYNNKPERYIPVAFEQIMYWEEEKIAGTCDLLLYDTHTGMLIPVDWKTNETDLFKVWNNKKLLSPFNAIDDCQFNKYELQLSYYKAMLKLAGFRVGPAMLVWLMPKEDKLYQSFVTRDYSDTLIQYHHDARRSSINDTIRIF